MRLFFGFSFLLLAFLDNEFAAQLELKEIMKGNGFIGYSPENAYWSADGEHIYFDWNPSNDLGNSPYRYSIATQKTSKLEMHENAGVEHIENQKRFAKVFYAEQGKLMCYDRKSKVSSCVFSTTQSVQSVQRVANPNHVYFVLNQQLHKYDATAGAVTLVSHLEQKKKTEAGESSFLEKQQEDLFEFRKDELKRDQWNKTKSKDDPAIYYSNGKSWRDLAISGDETFFTFCIIEEVDSKLTKYMDYLNMDGQATPKNSRSKVTNQEENYLLVRFNLHTQVYDTIQLDNLPDIRKKPAYLNDATLYENNRKVLIHAPVYSPNGKWGLVEIKAMDNKDRWLIAIESKSRVWQLVDHQHDEAWIGGPGISNWTYASGMIEWLDDNRVIFQSEKTGYSHLYLYDLTERSLQQLTQGKWEVRDVTVSKNRQLIYFVGNRTHPGNRSLYQLHVSSGKISSIWEGYGAVSYTVSPDEKRLLIMHSTSTNPWELYVAANSVNTKLIKITDSPTKEFKEYSWRKPDLVSFTASDGVDVTARLYTPESNKKNGAAVMFVHGAGYLQNAHEYWSTYYREYMFHNLLVDQGYTVLDVDYRASEGYGRDYRTAIYRHMGGRDLEDFVDAKKWLVENQGVDGNRIGIYGGSYGGFITLMALLTKPGEFTCGAALRSVTDWAHYNHEYTSNILNYPETDSLAYSRSSPIYYADGLEDPLIMLHGIVDANVQYQDVVRLSQRFIELGKVDWDLIGYPVEDHGFVRADSWADEYRRILKIMNDNLLIK